MPTPNHTSSPARPASWSGEKEPNYPKEPVSNTPATPASLSAAER